MFYSIILYYSIDSIIFIIFLDFWTCLVNRISFVGNNGEWGLANYKKKTCF